jgi:cephalosporin-C deacetylase
MSDFPRNHLCHFSTFPWNNSKSIRSRTGPPADFDRFWKRTLAETAQHPLAPRYARVTDPIYELVDVYDVTFHGFGGQAVKGWFIEPAGNTKRLPCLVTYIGYGGGRSLPVDHVMPAAAGFANLVMDTPRPRLDVGPG